MITRQRAADGPSVAAHTRKYLGEFVRGVVEIPYDAHLEVDGPVTWDHLAHVTRTAYH